MSPRIGRERRARPDGGEYGAKADELAAMQAMPMFSDGGNAFKPDLPRRGL